jgi:hypothetical protein
MKPGKAFWFLLVALAILEAPASAGDHAVWIDGNVTRAPWRTESHYYVEVDNMPYRILPEIKIYHRYRRGEKAYDEEIANVHSISTGQKIWIKVRHNDVQQIIIF